MFRPRVLIIEEDRRTVDELQDRFERGGFEAEVALSGEVGLSIIAERKMNVAVVDAQREEARDWQLLKDLKESDPGLHVILINGIKGRGMWRVARRAGAARFLSSPVNPDKVVTAATQVVTP